jgi:hypothetical protein
VPIVPLVGPLGTAGVEIVSPIHLSIVKSPVIVTTSSSKIAVPEKVFVPVSPDGGVAL